MTRSLVSFVRRACSTACGCKSRPNLMEVKGSEAQGRHREVESEGSVEQRYGRCTRTGSEAYGVGRVGK